ncbi:MAG: RNA methyltransferase [Bacillota bacterium]|nr:RNA methyltransferase [Bacillota bacterium]
MASGASVVIESVNNPRVREYRECVGKGIPGTVPLEGVRLVRDALAAGVRFSALYVTKSALPGPGEDGGAVQEVIDGARAAGTPVFVVSDRVGHSMGATMTPQGVFALARWAPAPAREVIQWIEHRRTEMSRFAVLLDGVQDPGNVGAIIRTAAALGASAIIAGAETADPASPKVIRASMGAMFRVAVGKEPDLPGLIRWAKARGFFIIGSDAAPEGSLTLEDLDWPPQSSHAEGVTGVGATSAGHLAMLVIGSEAHGVSAQCLEQCDRLVHIPMAREVESLNAASAAAIIIYAMGRAASRFCG